MTETQVHIGAQKTGQMYLRQRNWFLILHPSIVLSDRVSCVAAKHFEMWCVWLRH